MGEPSNIFVERQRSSKICYEDDWRGEEDIENVIVSTAIQEPRETLLVSGGNKKRIGCVSFTEEGKEAEGGASRCAIEGSYIEGSYMAI